MLERLATQRYISSTVNALVSGGFATADPSDGYSLAPTLAGQLAARHYVRLPTLAAARDAPMHASLPDLLEIICGAAEFSGVALRRSEKRQLAGMNKRAAAEGRPFVVAPESLAATSATVKPKKTISTPKEKLLVLVSDALGEQPTESLDYSMRSELDGVLKTGNRIADCIAALFAAEASSGSSSSGRGNGNGGSGSTNGASSSASSCAAPSFTSTARLAATANAHRLSRSLRAGCWDGTGAEVRQLPGVGRTLGLRLAAAGLGTMCALLGADGRDVERATGRPFPFGHQLVAEAAAMAPSGVSVKVSRPELRRGGGGGEGGARESGTSFTRWEFSVTLTRNGEGDEDGGEEGEKENGNALPPRIKNSSSFSKSSYAKLVVGTPENDSLLLCETVSVATFRSPYSVRLSAPAGRVVGGRGGGGGGSSRALPADAARPPAVVAAVLHDRVVGLDVIATPPASASARATNNPATPAPPKARPVPAASSSDVPPAKKAATSAAAARRQTNLFESFKIVPPSTAEELQHLGLVSPYTPTCVPEGGGAEKEATVWKGREKEKGKAAEVAPAAPAPAPAGNDDEFADVFNFL